MYTCHASLTTGYNPSCWYVTMVTIIVNSDQYVTAINVEYHDNLFPHTVKDRLDNRLEFFELLARF